MNLYGWRYFDLTKEMNECTLFELLELYKNNKSSYSNKCLELIKNKDSLKESGIQIIEEECEFLEGAEMKIALTIANRMTEESTK